MSVFSKNLSYLMEEKGLTAKELSSILGMKNSVSLSVWLHDKYKPRLNYAILIADYFNVSLDYLFFDKEDEKNKFKKAPPFDEQLKKILKEFDKSWYRMIKDKVCTFDNFYKWFNLKSVPNMDSVIKIADYLSVSLDYLVGRE